MVVVVIVVLVVVAVGEVVKDQSRCSASDSYSAGTYFEPLTQTSYPVSVYVVCFYRRGRDGYTYFKVMRASVVVLYELGVNTGL